MVLLRFKGQHKQIAGNRNQMKQIIKTKGKIFQCGNINNHLLRITLAIVLLTGCSNSTNQSKGSIYTLEFEVSNSDTSKFGRKEFDETGEVISVMSLCRKGDIVYLVDRVHNNIKAVNLKTGKVKISDNLSPENASLNDIAIHGERILVSTDGSILYALSSSLSTIEVKHLNRDLGSKSFIRNEGDLYIYSDPTDVDQNTSFDVSVNALRINDDLSLVMDTLQIGRGYNFYQKIRDGYELTDNRRCLQSTQFYFCLNGNETFPKHEYICRNIFVNENSISFFEFINNKIRVVSVDVL
jgi:hypothetical protein